MTTVISTSLAQVRVIDLLADDASQEDMALAVQLRDVLNAAVEHVRPILPHLGKVVAIDEMHLNAVLLAMGLEISGVERHLFLDATGVMFTATPWRYPGERNDSQALWYAQYDAGASKTWEHVKFGELLDALIKVHSDKEEELLKKASACARRKEALAKLKAPLENKSGAIKNLLEAARSAFTKK